LLASERSRTNCAILLHLPTKVGDIAQNSDPPCTSVRTSKCGCGPITRAPSALAAPSPPQAFGRTGLCAKRLGTLVKSGDIDDEMRAAWQDKKRVLDLKRAQELFDASRVQVAAKPGLACAQAKLSEWHYRGLHGVEKNVTVSIDWAHREATNWDARAGTAAGRWTGSSGSSLGIRRYGESRPKRGWASSSPRYL